MSAPTFNNSSDLLRRLEPAVRPGASGGASASRNAAPALLDSQRFDALLAQASAGELRSERPVEPACDLKPPLDDSQLQRLGSAADRAEAFGARNALMMLDGRGLVVDVRNRSVVAEMKPQDTSAMLQVDAALIVPAEGAANDASRGSPFAGLNALTPARIAATQVPSVFNETASNNNARSTAPKPR